MIVRTMCCLSRSHTLTKMASSATPSGIPVGPIVRSMYILTLPRSISKGDPIFIPILAMNRSRELWGPDAHEFKYVAFRLCGLLCSLTCPATDCRPERWKNLPDAVSRIPGVWGHLLTFLGGPRACIGYRFSLVE